MGNEFSFCFICLFNKAGATIHATAEIGGGSYISSGATVGAHVQVQGSMIMNNAKVGDYCSVENSYIGVGHFVAANSKVISEILG